jgi:hypothetical protein
VGHGGRPAGMRGWQGQPRKMVEYEHWQNNSQAVGRRAVGCKLVVLKMTCSQSGCKVQRHFLAPPARTSNLRCLVSWSKDAMRVVLFGTELPGTAPSRCIEAPRAPLERALDPGRPRPRRGPRESWCRGRGRGVVASCRSYLYRIEVSWRCPVASSAVPSVGSALSHNVRFPLRFGRDRLTSSQASQSGQR